MGRSALPAAFGLTFGGAEGGYQLYYSPSPGGDGQLEVEIGGISMVWPVDVVEFAGDRTVRMCGMTTGTGPLWDDTFWFELLLNEVPPRLRLWSDRVLWREDRAAA